MRNVAERLIFDYPSLMDLFEQGDRDRLEREQPLAARLRPRTLAEFVGQEHIIGPGRLLSRAIQADQLSSLIFYGPPGTGKTTLARVIANTTRSHFLTINAVLAGVKEIRAAIEEAQEQRKLYGRRTILFVDEVHRWNKAQQDALLPWVENGTIIMIGATTENPYFEVNRALVSRSRIFQLKPLEKKDLYTVARRALEDRERGYGALEVRVDPEALDHLVDVSGGDARTLLNALELAVETTPERFPPPPGQVIHVTLQVAEESIQRRVVLYDKEGDYHFDTISAFIKSLRGSDPDAALYWLARMVYAGEDPRFLFRRMLIFASEDVGLADPQALGVVEAAAAAFDRVGLPEGRFHLSQAALYLATAPKSNSTMGFFDALAVVEKERGEEVPRHLRDASRDQEGFGHGEGYLYPHAYRDHWVAQQYLPAGLQGRIFYQPGGLGYEARIREEVGRRRELQLAAMLEREEAEGDILSAGPSSPASRDRDLWLERAASAAGGRLAAARRRILDPLKLARHHRVVDLQAGTGVLLWELLRRVPEGGVWALVRTKEEADRLNLQAARLEPVERPVVWIGGPEDLPALLEQREGGGGPPAGPIRFDAAVGRNVLGRSADPARALSALLGVLAPGGVVSLAETVPALGTHPGQLLKGDFLAGDLGRRLAQAEEALFRDPADPRLGWREADFAAAFRRAGFEVEAAEVEEQEQERRLGPEEIARWFSPAMQTSPGSAPPGSYAGRLARLLAPGDLEPLEKAFREQLAGRTVPWKTAVLFIRARPAPGRPAPEKAPAMRTSRADASGPAPQAGG